MSDESLSKFKSLVSSFKYAPDSTDRQINIDSKHRISKLTSPSRSKRNVKKEIDLSQLKDLLPSLKPGLSVVFVGYNPSVQSSISQHHYAHHTNLFWKLFNEAGILAASTKYFETQSIELLCNKITADNDLELIEYGIGFTDLILRPTKNIQELPKSEMHGSVPRLLDEFNTNQPRIITFVGKGIWEIVIKNLFPKQWKQKLSDFRWGKQDLDLERYIKYDCIIYVIPSTSGLVTLKYELKMSLWLSLSDELNSLV